MNGNFLFRLIFLVLFVLTLGIRLLYKRRSGTYLTRGASLQRWRSLTETEGKARAILWGIAMGYTYVAMILYLLAVPVLGWAQLPFPEWLQWLGVGLCILAIPFLVWVHRTLGKHWQTTLQITEDHSLVTTGPYSRVRHPMYTVLISFNIGLILIAANLFVAIGFLFIIILTFARIPIEERLMLDEFGDEYHVYMLQTGRLLPAFRRRKDTTEC